MYPYPIDMKGDIVCSKHEIYKFSELPACFLAKYEKGPDANRTSK